ncbi:hypothetical protein V8F20_006649 [Naviculisporaceae sp. PSN 640]
MLTRRLSICSNLYHHQQTLFLFIFLLSLLSYPVDALAIPPHTFRLIRRDDDPGKRATRNEVVAALLTILVLVILAIYGIWYLTTTAVRAIHGSVTSSSYGSGSTPRSSSSVADVWDSPAVRFMRYTASSAPPPAPRVRNIRGQQVTVHDVHPPGAGLG